MSMLLSDFGVAIVFLIAASFYAMRNYTIITRVWLSVASVGLMCCMLAVSYLFAILFS